MDERRALRILFALSSVGVACLLIGRVDYALCGGVALGTLIGYSLINEMVR